MASTVTLAEYLFTRLRQLGVQSVHGVPGDYNLSLLDHVEPTGLHWVGNCNELNAGYATDGYARIKGLGALITTFGVGEISAANAIAGAYAEFAPVVHIVGTPARHLQESRALIHHTLNDGDFRRFSKMHAYITVAQACLWDPRTCPALVDATIQQCMIYSRPVYIEVPADMVSVPVLAANLESKIEIPAALSSDNNAAAVAFVLNRMYTSKRPMILVDGESRAFDILNELQELTNLTQWPTWTTVFGKGLMDETLPNFHGIWKGNSASATEKAFVKSRDLILCFGPHFSTTNTYNLSSIPDPAVTILFKSATIKSCDENFRDLPAKNFLSDLLKGLDISKTEKFFSPFTASTDLSALSPRPPEDSVTQYHFYRELSGFFRPGDVILAETGTAGHGCRDFRLPSHTVLFKPATWLSIGYMLPAAQGAALAQRELHIQHKWHQDPALRAPRTILLIGDGSFHMTVQELSTIIREKLNVVLFLINNAGYTIERCIHGADQKYNDIAPWRYLQAPAFFGAGREDADYSVQTSRVETWGDLQTTLGDIERKTKPGLVMVEVMMDREDAPAPLLDLLKRQKDASKAKS